MKLLSRTQLSNPGMSYAVLCHPICKHCPVNVLEKNVNPPVKVLAKVLDK